MKYLKTIENHPKDNDYAVSYTKPFYYIDKINYYNNQIKLKCIASMENEDDKIHIHDFSDTTIVKLSYLNRILYYSNNLEDCYEFLNAFIKSKKYNI